MLPSGADPSGKGKGAGCGEGKFMEEGEEGRSMAFREPAAVASIRSLSTEVIRLLFLEAGLACSSPAAPTAAPIIDESCTGLNSGDVSGGELSEVEGVAMG